MSNKLFAQIAALIVIVGLVFLAVVQVLAWQRTRERDDAMDKAQAESNAVLDRLHNSSADDAETNAVWDRWRNDLNSN